jgi:Skp family chaperone for outer membrane proteins
MRVLAVAVGVVLLAPAGALAQAGATPPRPVAPRPAPQAPGPPRPAQPAAQAPALPPIPQVPFQDGLKYAYLRVDVIAANSVEGRAANEKVKALNDQKVRELNERNKALQTAQQKLEQGGTVLNDVARGQLQQEVERQQRDIQRFTEDAQQDVQALQQQLQEDFQRKLNPIVDRVAREKQVHMVFSAADSGLVWADPTMDLTGDIIRAFDAAATGKPAAAAAPAPAPATPAAAPAAAPAAPGVK